MAKQNVLVLVSLAALVLVYASFRHRNARLLLEGGLIVGCVVLVVAGWWYWRNLTLYGDVFGVGAFQAYRPEESSAAISNWGTLRVFLIKMHRSFWGLFGWMNVPLPAWCYRATAALYILAALGGGVALLRRRASTRWATWLFLALAPVLYLLWVVTYGYRFGGSGWQGRYLFPVAPAITLLLAAGLANLLPDRGRVVALSLFGLAMLLGASLVLPTTIGPAYQRVTQPTSVLDHIQQPMDVSFDSLIRLAGYDLSVTAGEREPTVEVTLYWQATGPLAEDYKVFVHLVDLEWELFGQADGYPLDGQFPTSAWRVGDVVSDSHVIEFGQPMPPGQYRIAMGWYNESSGERLSIVREEQIVGTVAETAPFPLQP